MSSKNNPLETTDPFDFDFGLCHNNHDNHDNHDDDYYHSYGYCRI